MSSSPRAESVAGQCATCGTQIAPTLLSCPSCHALVHSTTLKQLAAKAQAASASGNESLAVQTWRDALDLLPRTSPQYETITRRIDELSRKISFAPSSAPGPVGARGWSLERAWGSGAALLILALSKIKLLLLGLTKISTLWSMLVFLGVYWGLYGWKFALGFVVCIYIHEMGHVASLARYGISASPPMFIPGIGALVRLRQAPANVHEDARVGLAGPAWGTTAGIVAWLIYFFSGAPIWAAIAHTAGWLNLFNLLPIWQLDGGRGFRALSQQQRWMAVALIGATFVASREPLLVIVGIGAVWNAFRPAPKNADWGALLQYSGLIVVLAVLIAGSQVARGP